MPKRHSRSDSEVLHQRHAKRVCISIEAYLKQHFGLPLNPDLGDPFLLKMEEIREYLGKVQDRQGPELGKDESLTKSAFAG